MRFLSLRKFGRRSKGLSQTEWQYPAQGYCPEDGRYYAVRAYPRVDQSHRGVVAPALIAAAFSLLSTTAIAFQDMASLVTSSEQGENRWTAYMTPAPAGSVHKAEMQFVDASLITGSVAAAGINVEGIGKVAVGGVSHQAKLGVDDPDPDEERIVRGDKQGRIVTIAPVAPQRAFSAGSLLDRVSMISRPAEKTDAKMRFDKSPIEGQEIAITMAFHRPVVAKPKVPVPTMLASLITNDTPDSLALGYAPPKPDYARNSPFEAILSPDESDGRFVPPIGPKDHAWAAAPLPPSAFEKKEQQCLAEAVYYEARGETVKGQVGVAQVVLNRVRNPAYPSTICGVVYQNQNMLNACQFSFACDGQKHRVTEMAEWEMAKQVAKTVSAGQIWLPEVGSATHYHATYVSPKWGPTMIKVSQIGLHIFYRTRYGGWS